MTPEALHTIGRFFLPRFTGKTEPVGSGLIHRTFHLQDEATGNAYALQQVNTTVFQDPGKLQRNYRYVAQALRMAGSRYQLPEMIVSPMDRELIYEKGSSDPWRMFAWVENATTLTDVHDSGQAYVVAAAFGRFSADLLQADPIRLQVVIPDFHNLEFRFRQLQNAVKNAVPGRLEPALPLLEKLEAYMPLVDFFRRIRTDTARFRNYILHHDAKISNILFDRSSGEVLTPVDLDTVMAGYYFSDFGDMVRSLAPDMDENAAACSDMRIRSGHYEALREGYLERMYDCFSADERTHFDYSGLLLAYMQSLRFMADYLNGDRYYRVAHAGHNLDRARNQLTLLQRLEDFLISRYGIARCGK
jgi:hypothetical protein